MYFNLDGSQRVADGVNILFNNNYSASVDANDAEQITNFDEDISINRSGKYLSIEGRPLIDQFDTIFLNMTDAPAYSIEAVQTPSDIKGKLMEHYVNIVKKNIAFILSCTLYLAADGYFMKGSFTDPLLKSSLHIITRMRPDANLTYLYHGPQKSGKGRKKIYAGKVDVKNIDKRRWKSCYEDEHLQASN